MNVPPGYNQQPNVPQGYGAPGGYTPPSGYGQVPQSGSYMPHPQPHGFRGATRQFFNPAAYRQPGTGAFGTASLIVSLVSLFLFCGLLSPISLVLGFVGLIGKKSHKGAALAGVILSIVPAALWVGLVAFGFHHAIFSKKYAEQAGGPVVAAVEEYKKDHEGRVPASLDTLVEEGYLPARWNAGFDDVDGAVKSVVEGKEWKEFLQYGPGSSRFGTYQPAKTGRRGKGSHSTVTDDNNWMSGDESYEDTNEAQTPAETTEKTYWLRFVGVDGNWSTSDDTDVDQSPEKKFDLSVFGGKNSNAIREIAQTKRKLEAAQKDTENKIDSLSKSDLSKARKRLAENERELKSLANKKKLDTKAAIKADKDCAVWLKAIGQELQVIAAIEAKVQKLESSLNSIKGSLANLRSQEAMAKIADNKQELAELQALLDSTTAELKKDNTSDYMGEGKEQRAAEDWLDKQYE